MSPRRIYIAAINKGNRRAMRRRRENERRGCTNMEKERLEDGNEEL